MTNMGKIGFGLALSIGLLSSPLHADVKKDEITFFKAVDARDAAAPILLDKIKSSVDDFPIQRAGMLSDEALCKALADVAKTETGRRQISAIEGLGLCRTEGSRSSLMEMLNSDQNWGAAEYDLALALGLHANKDDLLTLINIWNDSHHFKALSGLLHAVTFSRLSVSDLPGLDWKAVERAAMKGDDISPVALYFLARLKDIEVVISFDTLQTILKAQENIDSDDARNMRLLTLRLMSKFGDQGKEIYQSRLHKTIKCDVEDMRDNNLSALRQAQAILQFAPKYTDNGWLAGVKGLMLHECNSLSSLAFGYLQRHELLDGVNLSSLRSSDNQGLSMAVMAYRYGQSPKDVEPELIKEMIGIDFYRAWRAITILASNDDGKKAITANKDKVTFATLHGDIDYIITPQEVISNQKKRESVNLLSFDQYTVIDLETMKGKITISLNPAVMASAHFSDLVKAGGMDGTVWHRVIPNFVAQAGETPNAVGSNWPTIRDEWSLATHRIGTVGVATAGKDTGSGQFFINLNYNIHLDKKYTVFGWVSHGMDVAYALSEGDVITKASVRMD